MIYTPFFIRNDEYYEPYKWDIDDPRKPMVPKVNCPQEGLHSLYRFEVESEDELVVEEPEELCRRMVKKFKTSKCYNMKTEERKEIIEYLSTHPGHETEYDY